MGSLRTQLCGLAMPHKIPGSGMLIENEMQKSVEETHGSLQEPDDSYTYQAAGKRSGDEDCFLQEKRPRLMLNTFDGQSLEEEEHVFSRSVFSSCLQDPTMPDCSTSGGDLEDAFMLRDFPHPRHVCVVFPFYSPPCVSNSSHCNKCWCYSCEVVAPCPLWGTGLDSTDHCNATTSSWFWLKHKVMSGRAVDQGPVGSITMGDRPCGFSQGLYEQSSFCSVPLGGTLEQSEMSHDLISLHEECADTDCLIGSCSPTSSIVLIPSRHRSNPSTDSQPLYPRLNAVGDQDKQVELQHVEVIARDDLILSKYHALLNELFLNEAQGHLQVIVTVSTDYNLAEVGTAHIRTFFRKDRGDDILVLRELLEELFPDDLALRSHLQCVDELRRWTETSDDWKTFAGLLRDLEGNCYEEAPQPPGLSVPLRPYQRQSLQFMLESEQREDGFISVNYQPLQATVGGMSLMYSASLNHLLLKEPHEDRSGSAPRGGFLCEEMGLGKTIEILALILANPCPVDRCAPASSKGTLVVCPVSIVGQWANEVKSKLAANLNIYMYHGSKRIRDPKRLAKFDIVITTYATLGSDFSKATQATRHGSGFAEQFCPLLNVNWWRVVLDESHTVKDPAPLHSRACAQLKADRRWCCTGTPINTSIYDLYGQFLFLKLDPLDSKSTFRRRIGRSYERQCKSDDQTVLLWTLHKIMIRHTKQQKFNGRELLRLPPKTEQDLPVTFTAHERRAYEAVYQHVIRKFEQFRCWGPTVVSKNILQIMSLLLPLRRLCSGGFVSQVELIMSKEEVSRSSNGVSPDTMLSGGAPISPTLKGPQDEMDGECGICFELMECPTKTPCGHWFCSECVMSSLPTGCQGFCAICGSPVMANQLCTYPPNLAISATLVPLLDPATTSPTTSTTDSDESAMPMKGIQMKSKWKILLADLAKVRKEHDGAKVLIFSQFMQTIAWLKAEFKKQGINYRFISGDMPMKKRAQAIEAFQKDPPTTVFLLSIRTGAVGITLTAASHVYMLEEQAVGRCWRMGQERPVVIKRLYVENSVEANILKLLRSRMSVANISGSQDVDSSNRSSKSGKNAVADVAGCIRTDKQNLRLNEFEILFS
uniref:SNF2 family DNA-dependent ATPase n=1 Tax=Physcomitrium patens TaxID=3218 RepID=A0A7I4DZM6_PHYPA